MSPILHHRAERYERKNMPDGYRLTDEDIASKRAGQMAQVRARYAPPTEGPEGGAGDSEAAEPWLDKKPEPGEVPYWVERVTDAEEHTHHTREARDQCAAGDHQYAKLLDDVAEREKIKATIDTPQGVTTMAEEPIEQRLRRAWLNGFKEGVDRAAYAAVEATGKWDY